MLSDFDDWQHQEKDLPSSFSNKEPVILLCWVANMRTGNQVTVALETISGYTGPHCDGHSQ